MQRYITIGDFAETLGIAKNTLRRYAVKKGFTLREIHPPGSRGQITHALTPEDAEALRKMRQEEGYEGLGQFVTQTEEQAVADTVRPFFDVIEYVEIENAPHSE